MEALSAVCGTFPAMRASLAAMGASERPSYEAAVAVSLHLANKHRTQRGYANESVDQIAGDLAMSERKVRRVLKALDDMGIWTTTAKGNQHAPTKRTAAFLDAGASSGSRTEPEKPASSAKRTEPEREHRPVAGSASSASRTTPPVPQVTPRKEPQGVRGNSKRNLPAVPARPTFIQSAPDLARFARAVMAEAAPALTYREHEAAAQSAADRWFNTLAAAPDARSALASVESVLRWALGHRFWAGRVTTLADIADNWPKLAAEHAAQTKQSPAMSAAQQQNLETIARVAQERASA